MKDCLGQSVESVETSVCLKAFALKRVGFITPLGSAESGE